MDSGLIEKYFTNDSVQIQTITTGANSFTNIEVPSGAKAVLIDLMDSRSLTLKGVINDKGISLDSTTPIILPISADNMTMGVLSRSGSSQDIKIYFF